jgi:hypothetical protein
MVRGDKGGDVGSPADAIEHGRAVLAFGWRQWNSRIRQPASARASNQASALAKGFARFAPALGENG